MLLQRPLLSSTCYQLQQADIQALAGFMCNTAGVPITLFDKYSVKCFGRGPAEGSTA